jgi:hypothetical protein
MTYKIPVNAKIKVGVLEGFGTESRFGLPELSPGNVSLGAVDRWSI